jgi:ADP-ribose pyrophosphatase
MKIPYNVTRHEVHKIGRFKIVQDTLCIEGKEYPFSYIDERECVCIMPIVKDEVVLLRQYRHAINEWKLEFPCGSIEAHESPMSAAKRELLEETGFIAGDIIPLGSQYIRPGISTGKAHFFLAKIVSSQAPMPDPAEFIEVLTIPISGFEKMIESPA